MSCIFCNIIAGTIPSSRIYEDESAIAFLDINPVAEGQALVVSREHAASVDELSPEALAGTARAVAQVARLLRAAVQPDGINVLQNNGAAAGQVVFHYHVHLIPRREHDGLRLHWPHSPVDPATLQQLAARIRDAGAA